MGLSMACALRYHFCDKVIWLFAKTELVVSLENPAARSLVDGNQNNTVNTHTQHMKIAILTLVAASALLSACQQKAPPPPPPPAVSGK